MAGDSQSCAMDEGVRLFTRGYDVREVEKGTLRFTHYEHEEFVIVGFSADEVEALLWLQGRRDRNAGQSACVARTPLSPGVVPTQSAPPPQYGTPRWLGHLGLVAALQAEQATPIPARYEPRASPPPMPVRCVHTTETICAECRALQRSDGTPAINHSGKE